MKYGGLELTLVKEDALAYVIQGLFSNDAIEEGNAFLHTLQEHLAELFVGKGKVILVLDFNEEGS